MLLSIRISNLFPYKASPSKVIAIQQSLQPKKVSVGDVSMAPGVDDRPLCRIMGPVEVAPGKTPSQYIKDALQEELLMARAYDVRGTPIDGPHRGTEFQFGVPGVLADHDGREVAREQRLQGLGQVSV